MRDYPMRGLDAGIMGFSRVAASAPRGRTEIELSQSTVRAQSLPHTLPHPALPHPKSRYPRVRLG